MTTYYFTDLVEEPRAGFFNSARIGTHWGPRITGFEVFELYRIHGEHLPFEVMAAFYGDDDDWVGLVKDDVDGVIESVLDDEPDITATHWRLAELVGKQLDAEWGPFEVFDERGEVLRDAGGDLITEPTYELTWTSKMREVIDQLTTQDASDTDLDVAQLLREAMWFGIRNGA